MKRPLLVLTGPTAVGKSALSVRLAARLQGEILSCDSMQVYRHMDIGTDKISMEARQGIPHHLIDVLEPTEPFDVYTFQQMAKKALERVYANGHLPILAGGTGFYIQALLYDIDFNGPVPEEVPKDTGDLKYRRELEAFVEAADDKEQAALSLHERLRAVDADSAKAIHPHNVKRIIRALEYHHLTKEPISLHNRTERERESPYAFRYYVLTDDRKVLYERINERVCRMMEAGLVDEVRHLMTLGVTRQMTSMQGLGYREVGAFLDGELTLDEATAAIQQNTRHFAKRQLTWFKRERETVWIDKQAYDRDEDRILEAILEDWKCRIG